MFPLSFVKEPLSLSCGFVVSVVLTLDANLFPFNHIDSFIQSSYVRSETATVQRVDEPVVGSGPDCLYAGFGASHEFEADRLGFSVFRD